MAIWIRNFFKSEPGESGQERIETVLSAEALRIEQIVSRGQSSPAGFWYDQENPEWVILLKGSATLQIEGEADVELSAGDYLLVPARLRHRVQSVSEDAVWLAVHFGGSNEGGKLRHESAALK
jgi:cupin 2 domain-containing protein